MRVLLAGVCGFIGSHLADHLVSNDIDVVGVDNLLTGRAGNVKHLEERKNFHLVHHDVTVPLDRSGHLQGRFDHVMNLASPASPSDFGSIPLAILSVGSKGTENLLAVSVEDDAVFFMASTSEVYGDPLVHPQPEDYFGNVSSTGPRSCYDESKRFAEALVMAYRRTKNVDVRVARIFNTYGERMKIDDGRVVSNFIGQAIRNDPITVYGDGAQTRSFCYVSDQVRGLVSLMESNYQDPVNIGNPSEVSMVKLAETVIKLTGSSSAIEFRQIPPEREGDPKQRCPDISLATRILNWSPKVTLEDGLNRTIDHYLSM